MDSTKKPASGVYLIRCVVTEKVYVGSSVNLRSRMKEHYGLLRRGNHQNYLLQAAWNKYGENFFEITVLEHVPEDQLLEAEQRWIDKTKCAERAYGFNICTIAGSPSSANIQVWEGFTDPQGNNVTIINLHEFCRHNNLDFPSMHRLAKGKSKLKSYKGWTHRNSVRQRDYIKTYEGFIDPDGNPVGPITNLAEFCRTNGLDNTHMVAVLKGRICSHRGWTHVDARPPTDVRTYTGFVNPNGERVTITNLAEFCRANGLQPVKMHEIKNGKRKIHKGWTWRLDDE